MGIVRESISFTRQAPSVSGMGIGKAAIFPMIMNEIRYDQLDEKSGPQSLADFSEKNIYAIDTRKLPSFYEENQDRPVFMEVLKEMLDKVLTFNPNKLEHQAAGWVNLFFRLGREEEIWANPKWITDYTFNEFRQYDLKRTIETAKKLGANKAFVLGYSRGVPALEKWAIENGATNLTYKMNEPIQQACLRGDLEIVNLLLADPNVDPTANTADGKRYGSNERQYCIRRAAKEGHIDVVKRLLKDKRVDPSYRDNWALAACLEKGDFEMCKLLLTDPRVREAIFDMKPIALKRFENYRRTGQI